MGSWLWLGTGFSELSRAGPWPTATRPRSVRATGAKLPSRHLWLGRQWDGSSSLGEPFPTEGYQGAGAGQEGMGAQVEGRG